MKFAGRHVNDQMGRILNDAIERGWIYEGLTTKGHFKLRHPRSNQIQICGDSGDPAAVQNVRARLKRVEREFGDLTKSKLAEQLEKFAQPEIGLVEDAAHDTTEQEKEDPVESIDEAISRMERLDPTTRDLCRAIVLYGLGGRGQTSIGPLMGRSVSWFSAHVKSRILDTKIPFFSDDDLIAVATAGQRGMIPYPKISDPARAFAQEWADRFLHAYETRSKTHAEVAMPQPKTAETDMFQSARPTQSLRDAKEAYVRALADLNAAIQDARSSGMDLEIVGELPQEPPRILVKTVRDI